MISGKTPKLPLLTGIALLFLVTAIVLAASAIAHPDNLWVQSDYLIHLPYSTHDGRRIDLLSDLLNTIRTQASLDQRARFLSYFLIALDQKIRLGLMDHVLLPPSFNPILWLLHGFLGPVLLFLFVRRTANVPSALIAVAIYATSPGFLYVFTMNWLPPKALVVLSFLAVLLIGDAVDRRQPPGVLFFDPLRWSTVLGLSLAMLLGFFSDEYGFFAPLLLILMFWWRFLRLPVIPPSRSVLVNIGILSVPIVIFAVTMATIVPLASYWIYGIHFGYFGKLLGNAGAAGLVTVSPLGAVRGAVFNLLNLLAISTAPYSWGMPASGFPAHFGVQAPGVVNIVAITVLASLITWILARRRGAHTKEAVRPRLATVTVATAALVFFISFLALRHELRIINGFYYGAPFAVLSAILVAYLVYEAEGLARICAVAVAGWIIVVQFVNFEHLNRIWSTGSDAYQRDFYRPYLPVNTSNSSDLYSEMSAIVSAEKGGRLDPYLSAHGVSPRLIYLIGEICIKDPSLSGLCPKLVQRLESLGGTP